MSRTPWHSLAFVRQLGVPLLAGGTLLAACTSSNAGGAATAVPTTPTAAAVSAASPAAPQASATAVVAQPPGGGSGGPGGPGGPGQFRQAQYQAQVTKVEGNILTVQRTQPAATARINVSNRTALARVAPATNADLKPGVNVQIAVRMTPAGDSIADLLLIQPAGPPAPTATAAPAAAPGGGLGGPGGIGPSFLTDAKVVRLDGNTLTVSGPAGEQSVTIDNQTGVAQASAATIANVTEGSTVYVNGFAGQDGTVNANLLLLVTGQVNLPAPPAQQPGGGFPGGGPQGGPSPTPPVVASAPAPAGALQFRIVPAESQASYKTRETLAGQGLLSPTGTTKEVSGTITVNRDGTLVGAPSTIVVDLRNLKTDIAQRDSAIKGRYLESNRYPFATYAITRVDGVPANYREGDTVRLTLNGTLTLHNVSKPVTWTADVKLTGKRLTGTASADLKFSDFSIQPPDIFGFVKVEDTVHLELQFTADQA